MRSAVRRFERLERLEQPTPPADGERGRLLDAREVAAVVFRWQFNASWVLKHVAPFRRVWWGRECYWYEADVREWLREQELLRTRPGT